MSSHPHILCKFEEGSVHHTALTDTEYLPRLVDVLPYRGVEGCYGCNAPKRDRYPGSSFCRNCLVASWTITCTDNEPPIKVGICCGTYKEMKNEISKICQIPTFDCKKRGKKVGINYQQKSRFFNSRRPLDLR